MIENFLQYGQWVVLVLSILSLYLVSSVNHETRLNGYILTGISRFAGASIFIFVDLFIYVNPTPFGPWNLWAAEDKKSMFREKRYNNQ